MAKQNVTFGERHLEKFVIAVAGTVLAAMAFLFVIQDPYSIEVSGQTLGPSGFYPELDASATQTLGTLKNASPPEIPEWKPPTPPSQRTVTDLPVVFAPIHPSVPRLDDGIELGGKTDLVGILPPGKPALTTGRANATLPPPQVRFVGDNRAGNTDVAGIDRAEDIHWVSVFATVPRQAQQQAFIKARYAVDRQLLVVSKVEAERQRRLPGGQWGPIEKVTRPFATLVLDGKPTIEKTGQGDQLVIDPAEYTYIKAFVDEAAKSQQDILRPAFQAALPPESQLDWTVPEAMPDGRKFNWVEDWSVAIPDPRLAAEAAGPTRFDYRKAKAEIDALVNQGKYSDAQMKLDEALRSNPTMPPNQKKELEELNLQLGPLAQKEAAQREAERIRREERAALTLGPDVDLLWFVDLSATPGETYRYRVRLLALNPYAGVARKMRNPDDATKVVLTGEWSEWSESAALKPSRYLFCTGVDERSTKIELNQWVNGIWDKTNQTVGLGEPLVFQDKLKEFTYDAVPVAIEMNARYEERIADSRRGIRYRDPRDTQVVLFVHSDGEVDEHYLLHDLALRRELASEFAPKKDVQPRIPIGPSRPRDFGGPRDRMLPGRGGMPGPSRFRDEG